MKSKYHRLGCNAIKSVENQHVASFFRVETSMEPVASSETVTRFQRLHGVIFLQIKLFSRYLRVWCTQIEFASCMREESSFKIIASILLSVIANFT
jgi:hypothetical protein